jgi:putative chitinase
MITSELLAQMGINPSWLVPLHETFERYQINTPNRIAGFLGQTTHESANYKTLQENLNYSANGLVTVWPSRFPTFDIANEYARKPERIANKVYSNRMGNGSEESGDGWRYRGRGIIQITGRDNYEKLSDSLGQNFLGEPDLLLEPRWATMSAGWFWDTRRLNALCDKKDWVNLTQRINGGLHGINDRTAKTKKALELLGDTV